ncbi:tetratricopeptide repeat protein [Hymenobacter rubripertinctus]|uniref:Uncharacterized protein n=1 Tax=Hymenobacter rubripertinctus TaxID=2029981 RepID=A0A418R6R1_9BACT|nr:tetratricopeptide repeat protein [Hymenobacter rubripertinctus]RIY13005.1 hypothetical protein D0T11_04560 [Hymenobacter rubripertinctus]
MNRSLLLLLFLLLSGSLLARRPACAQAATSRPTAPAPDSLALKAAATAAANARTAALATQTRALRQARQLELDRRYESAWQLLQELDSANTVPAVVLQKANLALTYYTATEGLTRFAFRNLRLTDPAPDSLRVLSQDTVRHNFAVRRVLERLYRQYPDNYRLARALGDYFYAVQQCDCAEQRLGEDEVFRRTIAAYQEAHAHGQGDYVSYFALGYAYQRLGRFPESLGPFERSLELRPNNPTVHLNLAFVLLELRDLEKARYHARSAQFLFPDAHHKEDAGFLMKEIEERIQQLSTPQAAPPTEEAVAEVPEKPAATPAKPATVKPATVKPGPIKPVAAKTPAAAKKPAETSTTTAPKKPAAKKPLIPKTSEPTPSSVKKTATPQKTE